METNGGGWTLIQRRGTPIDRESGLLRESFIRGWEDYARGFGSLSGDFWIGKMKQTQELQLHLCMPFLMAKCFFFRFVQYFSIM